jgi:UDPglucose 6-dehydrogenase
VNISVIGCGYVGLVTGGCLAEIGHRVVCTDNDSRKMETLQAGKIPIYEPGLDVVLEKTSKAGTLKFDPDMGATVRAGDAILICVGTPPLPSGDADLSAIDNVARLIGTEAQGPKLVIEKSTVPAQTGQELKRVLSIYSRKKNIAFRVASNPEFLREGTGVEDFLHPDRIVIGVEDKLSEQQLREIYKPLLEQKFKCPIHAACSPAAPPELLVTTINSAELIKHASNSFLALKISYANMVADLCEKLGADVGEVMHAVGRDPRIGTSFLNPGLGFGGFCLPKDLQAFVRLAQRSGVDFSLLKQAEFINRHRIEHFVEKIRRGLWVIRGKRIAVLGLAFKPNTDDIRFAPSMDLIERLLKEGAKISAFDPQAMERARASLNDVSFGKDAYEVATGADALLIVTEWEEFRSLDWNRIQSLMARPLIVDGRNLPGPAEMRSAGFEYYSMGRPDENE